MTNKIPTIIATEDELSMALTKTMLLSFPRYEIHHAKIYDGYGTLFKNIRKYNDAAQNGLVVIICTDLDTNNCAPELLDNWLGAIKRSDNLLFNIAIHECESWLLADRKGFANFLKIPIVKVPTNPDEILDTKNELCKLTKSSRIRNIRNEILPKNNSTARIGPGYNNVLCAFIANSWSINRAVKNSPSLSRAYFKFKNFYWVSKYL